MSGDDQPPHSCDGTSAPVLTGTVSSYSTESDTPDMSEFRVEDWSEAVVGQTQSVRRRTGGTPADRTPNTKPTFEFFAAHIDLVWVLAAARLPGASFQIAMLIQHLLKLRGTEFVAISNGDATRWGVERDAKTRAIRQLVDADLIEVQTQAGRSPRVRVVGDRCRGK